MARLNIKPAAAGMSHHSYDVSTIASLDFGELLPTRCIETIKKDHFTKISANGILRLSPQIFPAYGKCFVKSAAFFVPEYQLFEASDAFHSNMNTWKGNPVILPNFDNDQLNYLFTINSSLYPTSSLVQSISNPNISNVPARDTYDFVRITDNSGSPVYNYYKLTTLGNHIYKILKSLGYEFAYYPSGGASFSYNDCVAAGQVNYNALPLLAYFKVYADFFLNPQFYNNSVLVAFLNSIQFGKSYSVSGSTWFDASSGLITSTAILNIFCQQILLPHQGGMYLDAWNSPNSPDGVSPNSTMVSDNPSGLISPFVGNYIAATDIVTTNSEDNFLKNHSSVALQGISAIGLRIIQQFDKFVRRRGLSGNKAVERIYSMFGIKSDFFSSHYCHKIFDSAQRIDFNAVLSNSNTVSTQPGMSGSSLGAYAGYASSPLNFSFEHKCDSFGYIICVSWLQVVPMLLHGVSPSVLRKYPFDFYTPEYDGQTVRAIPYCEIAYSKSGLVTYTSSNNPKNVFGFTNLYDDYRYMKDTVVGDFITSGNVKNFLFGRDVSVLSESRITALRPQSSDFHYFFNPGWNQKDMTDPFQLGPSNGDRFYLQLDFNIEADRPLKSESDAINLNGEGDLTFSMNGNSMS